MKASEAHAPAHIGLEEHIRKYPISGSGCTVDGTHAESVQAEKKRNGETESMNVLCCKLLRRRSSDLPHPILKSAFRFDHRIE